jgi:hypothetical protein
MYFSGPRLVSYLAAEAQEMQTILGDLGLLQKPA